MSNTVETSNATPSKASSILAKLRNRASETAKAVAEGTKPKLVISEVGVKIVDVFGEFDLTTDNECPYEQSDLPVAVYDPSNETDPLKLEYGTTIYLFEQAKSETSVEAVLAGRTERKSIVASLFNGDQHLVSASLGFIPATGAQTSARIVIDVEGYSGKGVVTVGLLHQASLDSKHPLHEMGKKYVEDSLRLGSDNSMVRSSNGKTIVDRYARNKPAFEGWATASKIGELLRANHEILSRAAKLYAEQNKDSVVSTGVVGNKEQALAALQKLQGNGNATVGAAAGSATQTME